MGKLNRIVELQRRSVTRDFLGGETVTWSKLETVWAQLKITGTSEDFENDANRVVAARHAEVTVLWRADISERDRVVYQGLAWDIEGIEQIGFRRETKLHCRTDVHMTP